MNDMLPSNVQIGDSVIYQRLKDEMVVLNIDNQHYYSLDDVGVSMWEALLEDGNIEAATARLRGLYQVDKATLRTDLESLVRDLLAAGLLKAATA
jgi:hypothetical protein